MNNLIIEKQRVTAILIYYSNSLFLINIHIDSNLFYYYSRAILLATATSDMSSGQIEA